MAQWWVRAIYYRFKTILFTPLRTQETSLRSDDIDGLVQERRNPSALAMIRDLHMRLICYYQATLNLRLTNAIAKDFIASQHQEKALPNNPESISLQWDGTIFWQYVLK